MKNLYGNKKMLLFCLLTFPLFFVSCDLPPEVTITSPEDGQVFEVDETITFSGTAIDPNDGELPGDSLVWRAVEESNLMVGNDEVIELGTGNTITKNDLPEGTYFISLQATDSTGKLGMDSVGITVGSTTVNN